MGKIVSMMMKSAGTNLWQVEYPCGRGLCFPQVQHLKVHQRHMTADVIKATRTKINPMSKVVCRK